MRKRTAQACEPAAQPDRSQVLPSAKSTLRFDLCCLSKSGGFCGSVKAKQAKVFSPFVFESRNGQLTSQSVCGPVNQHVIDNPARTSTGGWAEAKKSFICPQCCHDNSHCQRVCVSVRHRVSRTSCG